MELALEAWVHVQPADDHGYILMGPSFKAHEQEMGGGMGGIDGMPGMGTPGGSAGDDDDVLITDEMPGWR
jgi:hypothetical protein